MAIGDIVSTLIPGQQQPLPTLTPESVKRKRLLAEALAKQGMDMSPIDSPWQGAARLANAFVGGLQNRKLDRVESEAQAASAARAKEFFDKFGGSESAAAAPAPAAVSGDTPAAAPAGRSLPTFASDVTGGINAATAKYGLDPTYLPVTAAIESKGNPNAQNPNSSAGGLFQFINSTAKQYGLNNKFDPAASADAAARLATDNRKALVAALGRDPTPAELYLAHQQGGGGAAKLLANPDAPAASIVGDAAIRLNGGRPGMTAGEFANKWISKFNSVKLPGTQVASAGPSAMGYAAPQAMRMPFNPDTNTVRAQTAPYDPNAQPQSSLRQSAGLSIEPVPQTAGVQPPQAPQMPQDGSGLPSMAGGAQPSMQMPQQAAQLRPEQIVQAASTPQVQQAAQQAAQTPQGQQIIKQAQSMPPAAMFGLLSQIMSDPWMPDGQKALVMMLAKEKMGESDPMRQLQMLKLRQELAGGSPEEKEMRRLKMEGERLGLEKTKQELAGGSATQQEAARLDLETKRKAFNMPNGELVKDDSGNPIGFFDKSTLEFKPIAGAPTATKKAPETKNIKQADGSEVVVQWDRQAGEWVPLKAPAGGNPVTSPKLTEAQSKDVVFYNRGSRIVERLEKQDEALTSKPSELGGKVSNYLKSDAYRQAEQTGRELLAVILRKDTGAAVTDSEMELYSNIFLPKPADDAVTIRQKREARKVAMESIRMGLGSADVIFKAQEAAKGASSPDAKTSDPLGIR